MKKILTGLEILLITITLFFYNIIDFSNISFFLIVFFVCFLFKYTSDEKIDKNITFFSCIFSFMISIGNTEVQNFSANYFAIVLVELLGWYFLFNRVFIVLKRIANNISVSNKNKRINYKKFFIISFIFGLLCLIPYYLKFYPGVITNDTYWQLSQVMRITEYSNHHPWLHTLLIKFFYIIGYSLSGNASFAVSFFVIFQMIFASLTFTYIVLTLYRNNINKYIVCLLWVFLFLFPYNAIYSVTIWKDIPFAYTVLIFITFIYDFYKNNKKWDIKNSIIFVLISFSFCLLRSNGFIAYLIFILVFYLLYKKEFIKVYKLIGISIIFVLLFKIPLMKIFDVKKGDFVESLSIPLQQIGYVIKNDGNISDYELSELSKICNIENIKQDKDKYYYISDPIKNNIRENDKDNYLEKNKIKFFKVWFTIGVKNPKYYVIAWVKQTSGYFYHNYGRYWIYSKSIKNDGTFGKIDVNSKNLLNHNISKIIDFVLKVSSYVYYKFWSIAMSTYVILISLYFAITKKKNILPYIPSLAILLTLLIATPVASEFRYAYSLFLTFPVLLVMSLENINYKRSSKK